ncbi:hypothetical protein D3C78_1959540 [compost metagenome]
MSAKAALSDQPAVSHLFWQRLQWHSLRYSKKIPSRIGSDGNLNFVSFSERHSGIRKHRVVE